MTELLEEAKKFGDNSNTPWDEDLGGSPLLKKSAKKSVKKVEYVDSDSSSVNGTPSNA